MSEVRSAPGAPYLLLASRRATGSERGLFGELALRKRTAASARFTLPALHRRDDMRRGWTGGTPLRSTPRRLDRRRRRNQLRLLRFGLPKAALGEIGEGERHARAVGENRRQLEIGADGR